MVQYTLTRLRAEYLELWTKMRVLKINEANSQARQIVGAKARYKIVEARTGVPWFVVGCLHMRESNGSFYTWLHNGDPMKRGGVPVRTVHVPAGRPPNPDVSWEEGAYDALIVIEHFDTITNWGPEHVAYAAEKFNGWGYRNPSRNIPSPYLWGGTSVQQRGKFVRDGVYDANVMDPQLGAMAVLRQVMSLDVEAKFTRARVEAPPPEPPPPPPSAPVPPSPSAVDTESQAPPLTTDKSIWGTLVSALSGIGAAITGMFQYLTTPWGFAAFVLIVLVIAVGTYLVISGRFDTQGIIRHLSQDDAPTEPKP